MGFDYNNIERDDIILIDAFALGHQSYIKQNKNFGASLF